MSNKVKEDDSYLGTLTGQAQVKELPSAVQLPSFLHGLAAHGAFRKLQLKYTETQL